MRTQALATLAVQDRETSRYLLFDEQRSSAAGEAGAIGRTRVVRPASRAQALAFCGIHVISPRLLTMMTEEGAFSIITAYLRLAAQGEKILAFRADEYYWRDLGRPEALKAGGAEAARFDSRSEERILTTVSRRAAKALALRRLLP